MGIFAAKLLCLFVHHLNKIINISFADIIGKNHCGIVTRGNHHAVEQVDCCHTLADMIFNIRKGTACVFENIKNRLLNRNFCVVKVGNVFNRNYVGHNLCCGCRITL